ncbi:hypothetical protein LSH36_881g03003 [Paralvinella palmiformis]|uniref:Uncharacterized protein n=1 Tax=Paralvinella palmiformis TaxID=53620 RepID=A0AAD9IZB1_9ANNE|nr:hypothetical protein LSH36_881g03003 [Paralvinella palmiformis]
MPGFRQLSRSPGSPPPPPTLPTYKWFLTVYAQDILTWIEEIKVQITSTYRSILKLDSSKKRTTLFDYFFPDSVGPDNIAGFRHVDALCEYLLKLDGVKGLSLTDSQVSEVIRLWLNLNDYDKKKIIYVKRHQERLVQGRFHCSKKKKNVFLVIFLGHSGTPAQWSDCCRVVETLSIKLCQKFPSPVKKGTSAITAGRQFYTPTVKSASWYLILPEHNKRARNRERAILLQGVDLPASQPVAAGPLPLPQEKLVDISDDSSAERHHYVHAENTAGQVYLRCQGGSLRNRPVVPLVVYHLPTQAQCAQPLYMLPTTPQIYTPQHAAPQYSIPRTTQWHINKRMQEPERQGPLPKMLCAEGTLLISVRNVGIPESARQVTTNIRDTFTVHMTKL